MGVEVKSPSAPVDQQTTSEPDVTQDREVCRKINSKSNLKFKYKISSYKYLQTLMK